MPVTKQPENATLAGAQSAVEARLRELDEALASVADLERERDRLREALALLGGNAAPATAKRASRTRSARRPASSGSRTRYRNRDAVLAHLREHPGAEAGAIVAATGIGRGVAYNLLGRLVKQGLIAREAGPSQRAQYFVAPGATTGD